MADKQVEIEVVTTADTSAVEDLQTVLEETETSAQNLGNTIDTVDGSSASNASADFNDLGGAADEATTEVDELQNSLDLLNASALMSISNELSSLGGQAEGMAQEMNEAAISVGQLSTMTGMAEPQMVSLVNTISNATFPNDEAMLYIKNLSQMGVSADNFAASATNIDRINDAFGLGAQTTNSMATELAVLGVDMNNVSESFNALAYANANTKGGMENFYTFLRKYDAELNQMGYDVDQTALIISAATQKYGGGRAALSGLSEALKEADGDSRKLEQALGMQAGSLDNASAITGQYEGQLQALADEEAEHKTILDQIGAAWEDISLSLSGVLSPVASFMGLIGQVGSWATGINSLIKLSNTIRDLSIVQSLTGRLGGLRGALSGVAGAARGAVTGFVGLARTLAASVIGAVRNAITGFVNLGRQVLLAGANALRSAAMWVVQKAQLVASTIATYAAEAAQWALNLAMSMNPITIIIIAIVALIAVLGYLYFNNEQVRDAINNLGQTFVAIGQIIYTAMVNAVNWVIGALQNLWNYVITLGGLLPANVNMTGNQILDTIIRVVAFIATLPLQIAMIFTNIIAKALGFGNNFSQRMMLTAVNAVTLFANKIAQLPGKLQSELNNMLSAVGQWAATLPQKFWEAGVNAVKNFLSALGIASPGTMQRMLVWEVSEMGRRTPIEGRKLVSNVAQLGADIVDSFGDPTLGVNFDDTANATIRQIGTANNNNNDVPLPNITLNVEVGTVDSTDRVNEIVDAIRRELAWNNTTAGRSV